MKLNKKLLVLFSSLMLIFSLNACNKINNDAFNFNEDKHTENVQAATNPEELIQKSLENIKTVQSFEADQYIDVEVDADGSVSTFQNKMDIIYFDEPFKVKVKSDVFENTMPSKLVDVDDSNSSVNIDAYDLNSFLKNSSLKTSEIYIETEDNLTTSYRKMNEIWSRNELTENSILIEKKRYNLLKNMKTVIENIENPKEISRDSIVNGNATIELDTTIKSESVNEVINAINAFQEIGLSGMDKSFYESEQPINVKIYIDEQMGFPVKYTMDLSDLCETIYRKIDIDNIDVNKYTIDVVLSNFDNVNNFEIPQEAK